MNEHAKQIFHAWMDGKQIQFWNQTRREWMDDEPLDPDQGPHLCPKRWRIKPNKQTRWFRVYKDTDTAHGYPRIVHHIPDVDHDCLESLTEEWEEYKNFGGWLSQWTMYEAEIKDPDYE